MFDTENKGLTTSSKFLGLAGTTAGLGWDLFGDIYTLATDGYSLIIPDDMEESAKEQYREAIKIFVEHPLGKQAQKALEAGQEEWVEFKTNNPEMALVIESAFNVGAWFKRGPDAKPINVDRDAGYNPDVRFYDQANRKVSGMTVLERGIWRVISPLKSSEQRNKQTTAPQGPLRVQQTILTPEERRRVDTVKRLARVDPSRTDRTNAKSISDAITKLDEKLLRLLERRTDPVYHEDLITNIQSQLQTWISANPGLGPKRYLQSSGIQLPTTPLGQAATASAATNPKFFPFFAGLVSTYTGFGLTKRAFSKAYYNKELRLILESLNEGIKTATNPEMAKQLRADRAAIIEVYKGYMEDAEEEESEE